jgi:hypothetical protein
MTVFTFVRITAALGIATVLGATGHAVAAQPQPGQWKVVTKMTMSGLPAGIPNLGAQENTQMQCVTPEMAQDPKKWRTPEGGGVQNCTYKNSVNGNVILIEAACSGNPPSTLKGSLTFDSPTHYKGAINSSISVSGMAMQVQITMDGRRVGDCPK